MSRTGRKVAVDTHRNTLAEARTFLGWCSDKRRRWLSRNPLRDVLGTGKRKEGKEQLRIDEAREWLRVAIEAANAGETGAVAAMMALLMSLRATPIITRTVRDLDDDGRLLWVECKTKAGKRTIEVPNVLRPYLVALADGKESGDLLFGHHCHGWVRQWVKRICRRAGVPEVTAHGMRGSHASFAHESGRTPHEVAKTLGHESTKNHAAVLHQAFGSRQRKTASSPYCA